MKKSYKLSEQMHNFNMPSVRDIVLLYSGTLLDLLYKRQSRQAM